MAAPTITFDTGSTDVTVRAPIIGARGAKVTEARQMLQFSEGGQITQYDLGTDDQVWALDFTGMSDTDHTNLEAFVTTGASFGSDTFTYTDPWGTAHTGCRFVMPSFDFQPDGPETWRGTLLVRKDVA